MSNSAQLVVELDTGERRKLFVTSLPGSLADVLALHGLPLNTRCGQRGLCRGCEVELREGSLFTGPLIPAFSPIGGEGGRRPDEEEPPTRIAAPSVIKACKAWLTGDAVIHLPARSRIEHRPQVSETFEISVPYAHQPLFGGGDASSPGASRSETGVLPPRRDTAFAVDLGTTTVVVLLVDLATGEVLSRAGGFNEQIRFGDNVVTRIEAAQKPENLLALQRAVVVETLQPLLLRACELAGRSLERIAGGTIAANTTMLHMLVGEDPTPLGIAPFTPRFIAGRQVPAASIGLASEYQLAPSPPHPVLLPRGGEGARRTDAGDSIFNGQISGCKMLAPETPIQLLPGIAAYVGADITAGILATGMLYKEKPALLVDIGTNGEIVLQSGGKLYGCATAAGPAFEGCGLRCGTRARQGAVSDLNLSLAPFALQTEVIGKTPLAQATGICGSAYLDFLATARRTGLLGVSGRFDLSVWEQLPEQNRFIHDGKRAFRLVKKNGADDLRISEVDVSLLLQAKAAIGAGIEALLELAGIQAADVGCVHLAGGFGMHLDVAHAIAIGLLPGFRVDQVRVVGNTALAGALLALVDRTTLAEMENIRTQTEVVELNLTEGFEDRYVEHLMLP